MKKYFFLAAVAISFVHQACKNDIDVLADYKEQIVCYGILNPTDTTHYIRVSKIFVGEGDALAMAQVQDSIALRPENMVVKITRLLNNFEISTWILTPDSTIPREEGVFVNPHQVLYRGDFPVFEDGSVYRLTVTDLSTGYEVYSETQVVRDIIQTAPASVWQPLNFEDTTAFAFQFVAPSHGKRYELAIRFFYEEKFIFDTSQVSVRYVDWIIGQAESSSDQGGQSLRITVRRDNFFRVLANNIEVNPLVHRVSGRLDFIYTSVTDDFVTYMNVQVANNNSSADLPPFTNVHNGLGLFTTRNTTTIPNFHLDEDTQYALITSTVVDDLNFLR